LTQIAYPSSRTVDYTRNVLGQVTDVETTYDTTTQTVADGMAYEPFGPLSGLTFGNNLVMSRSFDQQYRLTAQTTGSVQDDAFTLDAAGNVDAIADGADPSLDQAFTQDALHRIDHEAGAYGTKDYTYDANGNRLSLVHDDGSITTQTLTYVTDSNRLATHDGSTVSLDAAGITTVDPAENTSFVYGDHDRMLEAYVGGVLQATYIYNGQGQRVKKVEATGAQRTLIFHYGLDGELLGETVYDSLGAKIGERDYVWLDSLPLAQSERTFSGSSITSDQFVYLHADQLNTPRLATDATGTVVWRWDSDAFGIGAADLDPDGDMIATDVRLRFPGQYFDEETGLYYNYFRDYDPVIGRYPQPDPIGLLGGINPYSYALNNPIGLYDPYGLWVPPSLPQSVVDAVTGFGDGAYAAVTLGLGDLQDVRDLIGVDGNVDACSDAYGAFNVAGMGVGSVALAGAGSIKALQYTGPLRNWLRFGRSYSQSLGQEVRLSLRWGASPAKQGKYLRQIPSQTLRQLNQWLRQQRIPLPGWRYADPAHLNIWP
jgi:RHS repeat-associated protein